MRFHKIENHLEWIINFGFCVTHNPSRTEPAARATGETTMFAITVISARGGRGEGVGSRINIPRGKMAARQDGGLGSARQCSARARPRSCTHVNCQLIVCAKGRFRPVRWNLLIIYWLGGKLLIFLRTGFKRIPIYRMQKTLILELSSTLEIQPWQHSASLQEINI